MPYYDYKCEDCELIKSYLRSVEERDDPVACDCYSTKPMKRTISAHQGYTIKGNNGASQRPRNAGSFKRGKQG